MPNWCEGTLRVRGKGLDIVNFFGENLVKFISPGNDATLKNIWKCSEYSIEFEDQENELFFKDSERLYVEEGTRFFFREEDAELIKSYAVKVYQAWSIKLDYLQKMSKKYSLEMKILAFESGGEFAQDIYVKNGEIVKYEKIEYDDWTFDCPCPLLGG